MNETIFLVTNKKIINEVYSQKLIKRIGIDGTNNNIYNKEDVLSNPFLFKNVKYVFSTWNMPEFTESEIDEFFPNLEAVFYAAGTVKYFAEPFLKKEIKIFSSAIANGIPVAEFTTAQIILANKGYFQAMLEYRKELSLFSYKKARTISMQKYGNYGAKIGIIGAGTIGKKVIELLNPYNLNIYVSDPYITDYEISSWGANKVDMDFIFSQCDIISNHLPDLPETQDLINYSLLSKMKSNATFINTGRGRQIVDRDLVRVLKEKPNACALLDVTRYEPLLPFSKIRRQKNILLSPHIAGSLKHEKERLAEYAIDAYFDYVNGNDNRCEVTLNKLERMA